jgi:hypothetical protein
LPVPIFFPTGVPFSKDARYSPCVFNAEEILLYYTIFRAAQGNFMDRDAHSEKLRQLLIFYQQLPQLLTP